MKRHVSLCLLALGLALAVPAQEGPGIRLHGTVAAIVGTTGAAPSLRSSSQGGEASPVGAAVAESYTLFSGTRLPPEVDRILRYTLSAGWNILGAPGVSSRSVGDIFVGNGGATIKTGPIQYFDDTTLRYVRSDDSARILPRQGFWLFSYWGGESRTFTARPHLATRDWLSEIPRNTWVLYSPPGKIILEAEAGLTIHAWDTQTQTYQPVAPGETIEPLRGYWVYLADE